MSHAPPTQVNGTTAVFITSTVGCADCLSLLLEAGGNPDTSNKARKSIRLTIMSGRCSHFMTGGASQDGVSALISASARGQMSCVKLLLKAGADTEIISEVCHDLFLSHSSQS